MVQKIVRILTLSICFVASSVIGIAQSGTFDRTSDNLNTERITLLKRAIDLKLQQESLNTQCRTQVARAKQINEMPAGIGRDAALKGFERDEAALRNQRTVLTTSLQSFQDDFDGYTKRKTEHERRLKAAAQPAPAPKATLFKAGDSVRSKTIGKLGTVVWEEGGRYLVKFITFPNIKWGGPVYQTEWVGAGDLERN